MEDLIDDSKIITFLEKSTLKLDTTKIINLIIIIIITVGILS